MPFHGRKPPGATMIRLVYVWDPPVGAPIAVPVSQVASLTMITSPLDGVKLGVVSAVAAVVFCWTKYEVIREATAQVPPGVVRPSGKRAGSDLGLVAATAAQTARRLFRRLEELGVRRDRQRATAGQSAASCRWGPGVPHGWAWRRPAPAAEATCRHLVPLGYTSISTFRRIECDAGSVLPMFTNAKPLAVPSGQISSSMNS
jgi:hypothetical protein